MWNAKKPFGGSDNQAGEEDHSLSPQVPHLALSISVVTTDPPAPFW